MWLFLCWNYTQWNNKSEVLAIKSCMNIELWRKSSARPSLRLILDELCTPQKETPFTSSAILWGGLGVADWKNSALWLGIEPWYTCRPACSLFDGNGRIHRRDITAGTWNLLFISGIGVEDSKRLFSRHDTYEQRNLPLLDFSFSRLYCSTF